ncbi:MAG: bifunctional phosphopantothenoylcysteine decarboxylase/phosphopantothenate--cysteine ligase CoaBC [Proteobacteria bacterium]|nr:bifunctional phosphopantothenoylcysteine decarboxylase/phosphopantothenate--cysteine ligase CoaBC [Pseudomonadota bacterium]
MAGKRILLGVTGGIGAYKAAELVRAFVKEGAHVDVAMTRAASRFITPMTLETLSRNPVAMDMFTPASAGTISHIELAQAADIFLVAPATANYLGKAAAGIADDLLTTISLVVRCPIVLAPAMNSKMWSHPAVGVNTDILRSRGVSFVLPEEGELACGQEGPGRLAGLDRIMESVARNLSRGDLQGLGIIVTAGPTREPLDPVRFITNRSTGKMGYAIAEAAARRGARVHLVSGPVELEAPRGAAITRVGTAREMLGEVQKTIDGADWLIMAAAVADFAPAHYSCTKIPKEGKKVLAVEFSPNPDILLEVLPEKGEKLFVGFAAQTGDPVPEGKKKMARKGLDLMVANDVSREGIGFGSDDNEATLLDPSGREEKMPTMPKTLMADRILDRALELWREKRASAGKKDPEE